MAKPHKNPPLTWERLDELFHVNPDLGLLIWKKNLGGRFRVNTIAGDLNHRFGYVPIRIDRVKYKRHRLIWFYVYREWPPELDHINGIRNDDRIDNLRKATRAQNLWNQAIPSNNTSGHKGISWRKDRNKWTVTLMVNGVHHCIGLYSDIQDAITARKLAEQRFHKGFIRNVNHTIRYPSSHPARCS